MSVGSMNGEAPPRPESRLVNNQNAVEPVEKHVFLLSKYPLSLLLQYADELRCAIARAVGAATVVTVALPEVEAGGSW